jgi:ABC-type nickel/cobalt efflux system permease component RcnA
MTISNSLVSVCMLSWIYDQFTEKNSLHKDSIKTRTTWLKTWVSSSTNFTKPYSCNRRFVSRRATRCKYYWICMLSVLSNVRTLIETDEHTHTHTHKHTNTQTHKHTNTQTHWHLNLQCQEYCECTDDKKSILTYDGTWFRILTCVCLLPLEKSLDFISVWSILVVKTLVVKTS